MHALELVGGDALIEVVQLAARARPQVVQVTADQFKGVHQLSTERGSIPVVASVDAVRITGDTALAEATVYTSADPSKRTARTFDLQRTDGNWKVCDPAGTP